LAALRPCGCIPILMKQIIWKKLALTLVILVSTSIGGGWVGNALTPDAKGAARATKWISLGTPPEAAVQIAGEFFCDGAYGVVVQSASGSSYQACSSGWRAWNYEYGTPGYLATCQGDPPTQYSPGFDSLPHPVKDCRLKFTYEWAIVETVYTTLEDGSVWQWNFTYGIGTIIAYWLGGLSGGLAVGIMISIWFWRRDRQRKRP
jgi:hypothetical protein